MLASGVRHAEPSLRLTRRGRIVVAGFLLMMFLSASAVLFTSATQS